MFLVGGFESVFRGIALVLCNWIYSLIPNLYSIFYYLADSRFIESDIIKTFSTNIYVLVSVVMLFSFAVKLLQAIVNPDVLSDSKKGVTGVVKRVFISLALIILIPFAFDKMYELQHHVISNSLIEKLLVGIQTDSENKNIGESSNAGQVLAAMTISGLLYPEEGATTTSENLQSNYNTMINDDIGYIDQIIPNINETYVDSNGNKKYVLNFNGLVALIAGIFVVYMLILFCFDTALRFIKLGFLELTAPISIMAYIYNGSEFLSKWFKETLNTFLALFIRVAALALLIYGMHILPDFMENFGDVKGKFWIQLFIIIGLLTFAKAAPDLVKTITGVTMKGGGVSRRLGEMAAVGAIAQNAWKSVGKTAGGVAKTAAMAPIGAVGGASKAAVRGIDNNFFSGKGSALVNRLKDSKFGGVMSGIGASITAGGGMKGAKAFNEALGKNQSFAADKYNREQAAIDRRNKIMTEKLANNSGGLLSMNQTGGFNGSTNLSGMAADNVANAFSQMISTQKFTPIQQSTLEKHQKAQNKQMRAQNSVNYSENIVNKLKLALEASDNQSTKGSILNLINNVEGGNINFKDLSDTMSSIGLDTSLQNQINGYAQKYCEINNIKYKDAQGNLNSKDTIEGYDVLNANLSNAQAALDVASSNLDKAIESATEDTKVRMKKAKAAGKAMNKKNTNTL